VGGGVGVGLRRPPLADVGSIQIKSNAAVNTEQVFSNIAVYTHAGRVGRDPTKEANGKTTRERLRDCYLSWSTYNMRVEDIGPRHLASAATSCYSIFSQNPRRFGIFGKTSWPW